MELGVQVGQGLVHQQHPRLDDEGPGQGHPLLLPAGQLVGLAGLELVDLHHPQCLVHPGGDLLLGHLPGLQAVGHVVEHVVVGQQSVALEHHGGVPLMGGQVVDHLLVKADLAPVHRVEARDHAQQGGLAAAGGA